MTSGRPGWSATKKVIVGIAAVITFIGVLAALFNDGFSLLDRLVGTPASSAPASSEAATTAPVPPSPAGPDTPSLARPSAGVGCRSADGEAVDCQLAHRYETYDGQCDTDGLISWLGGRPDVDVARGVSRRLASGACEVDLQTSVTGSAREGFDRVDSAPFRKCVDDREASVVACDRPHDAEFIAADTSGVADDQACRKAAADYLQVGIDRRSTELRVRAIASEPDDGVNARCLIQVVGSERLDVSVRGIGNRQLKWVS